MSAGWLLLVSLAAMTFWWIVSLATKDVSVVDRWWGLGFVLLVVAAWQMAGGTGPRFYVFFLVLAWGVRLAAHLYGRYQNDRVEDRRYVAMRQKHGDVWWWRSLFQVFWLQGVLMFIVAAAAVAPLIDPPGPSFGWLDMVAVAVAVFGLVFEGVADAQLQLWRRKGAPGGVMDTGLWRYTRHPNYFGEAVFWWGIWLAALAHGYWWTFVSPVVITILVAGVSGKPLLEKDLAKRRPAYAEYVRRTSGFIPWPPKR